MDKANRNKAFAAMAGAVFALYLFVADIAIPGGSHAPNHYDVGNVFAGAVFFSYAVVAGPYAPFVSMAMYGAYACVATGRQRRVGLVLFALHYVFALLVELPFYLHRSPDLLDKTRQQMTILSERPATVLFCFGPFVLANLWFLARVLRGPAGTGR